MLSQQDMLNTWGWVQSLSSAGYAEYFGVDPAGNAGR